MSITNETVQKHLHDPAIFCCRREKGLVISGADLEDPGLFPDLVDSGLIELSDDGLTIEQVLGCKLIQDVDALTPIKAEYLDKVNEVAGAKKPEAEEAKAEAADEAPATSYAAAPTAGGNGMIHIEIGKAEKFDGLKLDVPVFAGGAPAPVAAAPAEADNVGKKTVIRSLVKKHIKINDVLLGNETSIKDGVITIDKSIVDRAIGEDTLCKSLALDIIHPDERHIYTETIMDVCPIATKVEGAIGSGVTKVCDGVVFMLTGVDEDGTQVHEFGSSEGYLDEKMYFGHPGCADENDIIIRCHAVIERLSGMTRQIGRAHV